MGKKNPSLVKPAPKKEGRKFIDYTLFAKCGRVEKPVATVSDFSEIDALKANCLRDALQGGSPSPVFRVIQRDFDDSRENELVEEEVS